MRLMFSVRATAFALVVVGALASGCAARSVNRILADPSRYRDREVRVSGRVVDSFSVLDRGVYRIDDRSGQLWVVSDRGVPRIGADVKVRGTIRDGFNLGFLGDRIRLPAGIGTGIVLVESSHTAR